MKTEVDSHLRKVSLISEDKISDWEAMDRPWRRAETLRPMSSVFFAVMSLN